MNAMVEKAMRCLNGHDWFFRYAELNYTVARDSAYRNMRNFVEAVAMVEDEQVKQALLDLWMANWRYCHNKIEDEEFKVEEAKNLAIINA